jgi:hypothetical protein
MCALPMTVSQRFQPSSRCQLSSQPSKALLLWQTSSELSIRNGRPFRPSAASQAAQVSTRSPGKAVPTDS